MNDMVFRTEVAPLKGLRGLISHDAPVVMMGSCFTDNVGALLQRSGFDVCVNPCGTLYNPASIASALLDILYERRYTRNDLMEHGGVWHSWGHHSRFSDPDPDQVVERINSALAQAADTLSRASVLIVTFGTAWIYRLADTRTVVANCHKQPASMFTHEMLTAQQVTGLWKKMLRELHARYPQLKVLFTVSPIRHLADGAHGNQLSKATLLLAIDQLIAELGPAATPLAPPSLTSVPNASAPLTAFPDAIYFPAYEIVVDDLRDYRFYAADMVHPSDVAVDYIYRRFCESFMTPDTIQRAAVAERQWRRSAHRPLIS